jgi:hypothetical protein
VAGWSELVKNLNESIGNRSRTLPACSSVPQPTAYRDVLLNSFGNVLCVRLLNAGMLTWRNGFRHVSLFMGFVVHKSIHGTFP